MIKNNLKSLKYNTKIYDSIWVKKSFVKNITFYSILMFTVYSFPLIISPSLRAVGKKVGIGGQITFEKSLFIWVRWSIYISNLAAKVADYTQAPTGGSPFSKYESPDWRNSPANGFLSISILGEWNIVYFKFFFFLLTRSTEANPEMCYIKSLYRTGIIYLIYYLTRSSS